MPTLLCPRKYSYEYNDPKDSRSRPILERIAMYVYMYQACTWYVCLYTHVHTHNTSRRETHNYLQQCSKYCVWRPTIYYMIINKINGSQVINWGRATLQQHLYQDFLPVLPSSLFMLHISSSSICLYTNTSQSVSLISTSYVTVIAFPAQILPGAGVTQKGYPSSLGYPTPSAIHAHFQLHREKT